MIDLVAEKEARRRTALPIGVVFQEDNPETISRETEELAELAENLNYRVLEPLVINCPHPQARYQLGSGKAEELAQLAHESEADELIFDVKLTPSQQRNWEKLSHCRVLDREELILDIFASRAHTREAVLQVELARAKYHLPRLTGAWSHFSRQRGGGATTRGEGEAQLETDRRLLKRRIKELTDELHEVEEQRHTQRKARMRRPVVQVALVGYTNVGKSSLLQALTGSEVYVKDQLFATLDPTARRVKLPFGREVVLSDTVGFVRRLPHQLIEAFKSTLEEAVLADYLLLVLDVSNPEVEAEWETTLAVLKELGAEEKRIKVVFNKIDAVDKEAGRVTLARLSSLFPDALYVSAATGEGIDQLRELLAELAGESAAELEVKLPPSRHDLAAMAHRLGIVYEEKYDEDGSLFLHFAIENKHHHHFAQYLLKK